MVPIVADRRAEIAEPCRHCHVKRLDLFGSAACGHNFMDQSDVDLLNAHQPDHPSSLTEYLDLRYAFAALFGRDVDLAMRSAIENPYLRSSIDRPRQALHGA